MKQWFKTIELLCEKKEGSNSGNSCGVINMTIEDGGGGYEYYNNNSYTLGWSCGYRERRSGEEEEEARARM